MSTPKDKEYWKYNIAIERMLVPAIVSVVTPIILLYSTPNLTDWVRVLRHPWEYSQLREGKRHLSCAESDFRMNRLTKAADLYKKAETELTDAANDMPIAMTMLATIYHCGRGRFIHRSDALYHFYKAKAMAAGNKYAAEIPDAC